MLDRVWWQSPQTVLQVQASGTLALNDIKQMMDTSFAMIENEGRETGVAAIIDISRCEHYARDLMNMQAVKALSRSHAKLRWVIIIDPHPNPVVRFVGVSVLKIFRLNFSPARSEAEALEIIQRITSISS